jgi:predicted RNA binding protein YcfA (HicA-like mRNA interferase family)
MKVKEVLKILEKDGWYIDRTRGSHRILKNMSKSGIVVVPGKPSDEIPVGTLSSVWKQAKLGENND